MKSFKKDRLTIRKGRSTRRLRRLEQLEDRRLLAVVAPIAENDLYRVGVDAPFVVEGPGVLANDTGSAAMTAQLFSGPSHGTISFQEDGSFTYTPNAGFEGIDSFMYWANDNGTSSMLAAVTLRVTPNGNGPLTTADAYTVNEDNVLSVPSAGVLDNDLGSGNGTLTATIANGPANGTLTLNEDGSFTYVPNANFNGTDVFSYIAHEANTSSEPTMVTITVRPQNDKPIAENDSYSATEDESFTSPTSVLANDSDIDGDALTAVLVTGPQHGTVEFNSDGTFTYTPNADYNGIDGFSYLTSDGVAQSEVATVTINIAAVNDAPVAADDAYSTDEDSPLVISASGVLGNDTDVDGDTLTATVVDGPLHGTLTLNSDGSFTYTPNANYFGTDEFTYTAGDGSATSNVAKVILTVNPINDAPVANNDEYDIDEDSTLTVDASGVLDNDTDADGDTLTPTLVSGPQNGTLTLNEDGSFVYTPNANFYGTDGFSYTVSDGTTESAVATVTINVAPVNDAPIANNDEYNVDEDGTLTVDASGVLGNDSDPDGDALTPTLVSGPQNGTLTFNPDGSFVYTPNANFNGVDGFSYTVNDGTTDSAVATVTINVAPVNDTPVANNDEYNVDEDNTLTVDASGVLGNDSDPDGDTLTPTLVSGPQNGTLTFNEDGSFTYTPNANFNGVDGFSYTVSDGTTESAVATVTINVAPVNDAPVANNDEYNVEEDGELVIDPTGILQNDVDVDGDTLTPTIVSGPQHGTLTLSEDGSFVYTPNPDFNGVDGFSYTVSDGTTDSAVATVTINVGAVNDAPTAVDDTWTVEEDGTLVVDGPGVLANDTDIDLDTLTPTVVTGPQYGTLTLNSDGSFTYTPNADFHGEDSFTYTVNDGTVDSAPATVTISVTPVNDVPVANDDNYTVGEDATLTVDAAGGLLANDTDVDGDPLTPTIVTGPQHGTLTLNDDGSFSYTPHADFNGTDSFTYSVNDGTADSAVATVNIAVEAANDPPTIADDNYSVDEDSSLTVDAGTGLLANDSDVDGDTLIPTVVTGPQNGSLTLNDDGSFSYTPHADFHGTDSFTYTVNDGTTDSTTATVTITVNPVNDAPVAVDDSYSVDEDSSLTIDPAGVLGNDTDVDGDALTAIIGTGPQNGTLTLNSDGSFTYTPNADFFGTDTFTYTVSDGTTESAEATVTIEVTAVNDAPTATADEYTLDEDTTLNVDASGVLGNDSDPEGDLLTAVLVNGPQHGTLTLNSDGSFSYTPSANYYGTDSFVYKANDGSADSAETTVTLTINDVPDAPIGNNDAYSIGEDTTLNANVLANDFDPQSLALTAELVEGPTNGTLTLNSDGSFSYVPNANYHGTDSFTYKSTNGVEESEVFTATITVQPLNDAPTTVAESYDVNAGSELVVNAANGVLANDTDVDGDTLTARLLLGPAHGTLTFADDGSFSYVPESGFTGTDSFYYQTSDGLAYGNVVQVTLNVGGDGNPGEENSAPQAAGDSYIVLKDSTLSLDGPGVLGNDTDADGDALSAILVNGPAHGTLTLNSDGSLSYTPEAGYVGEDSFTYKANDGTDDSNEATVTITVREESTENSAPVSADDNFATSINTPLIISPAGVLANDVDANGDTLTATIVTNPTNGTLTLSSDGSFTYTPNEGYVGNDSFTYTANDGLATGNTATVHISVSAVDNTRPNALNDQFTTSADTPLIVPGVQALSTGSVGVLANDSDAQNDGLTAVLFSGPQHGTLTLEANGSFVYTPNAGYVGLDSFIYRAFDGVRYSALAAVTIRITASPAAANLALINSAIDAVLSGQDDEEDAWLASAVDALFGNDGFLA